MHVIPVCIDRYACIDGVFWAQVSNNWNGYLQSNKVFLFQVGQFSSVIKPRREKFGLFKMQVYEAIDGWNYYKLMNVVNTQKKILVQPKVTSQFSQQSGVSYEMWIRSDIYLRTHWKKKLSQEWQDVCDYITSSTLLFKTELQTTRFRAV